MFEGFREVFARALLTSTCAIGVASGAKGDMTRNSLENLVVLCFERRCPKQNTVARLK